MNNLLHLPLTTLAEALGGLGLFILGMKTMSEGLQRLAGNSFRSLIEKLAGNRLSAAFLGSCLASLLQSGSSAAIIVVGFVNAGLISMYQALGILLGTGVGSTLAVQFIAFQITDYSYAAIFIGVVLKFFGKKRRLVYSGELFLGAGLVFLGLKLMEVGFTPIGQSAIIHGFSQYVLSWRVSAVLLGALITLLVQSGTTATGIVIALVGSGFVSFPNGIAMVIGENLGIATITLVATLNGTLAARRTALVNMVIAGTAIAIALLMFPAFMSAVRLLTPGSLPGTGEILEAFQSGYRSDLARHIANAHTLFNIFQLVVFLPLVGFFTRSAVAIMPGKEGEGDLAPRPKFIDARIVNTPTIAMMQVRNETRRMADIAGSMYADVVAQFYRFDSRRMASISQKEEVLDVLQREISAFLVLISRQELDSASAQDIPALLQIVNSFEHMGDGNWALVDYLQQKKERKIVFSSAAMAEIKLLAARVEEIVKIACRVSSIYSDDDLVDASDRRTEITKIQDDMLHNHLKRMKGGHCSVEAGLLYGDMLAAFQKVSDNGLTIIRTVGGAK
jgi:phosphate:Na+ symporter